MFKRCIIILCIISCVFCLCGCRTDKKVSIVTPSINVDSIIRFSIGGI